MQRKACKAEFNIIVFFTYLLVYLMVALCQDAITIAWQEPYGNLTKSYFFCEAVGHVPGRCSREALEQYTYLFSLLNCMHVLHHDCIHPHHPPDVCHQLQGVERGCSETESCAITEDLLDQVFSVVLVFITSRANPRIRMFQWLKSY